MKKIVLILFSLSIAYGAVFDFIDIKKANNSYKEGDFNSSIKYFKKIKSSKQTDEAKYNLANSYYKSKDYKNALKYFSTISTQDKELKFKTLHNLGNTNAMLNNIDKAIKNYEEALKIKDDKDTKYNLELLKKQKKQNKQQNKDKKNKKDNKKKENKKDKNKNNSKQNKNSKNNKNKQSKQNKKEQQKNKQNSKKKEKQKEQSKQSKQKQDKAKKQQNMQKKKVPISNIEEAKYKKMLNNRGVNTLLLPINTKGDKNEELKPW